MISCLRPTLVSSKMTKYAIRPKPSSGLLFLSPVAIDTSLTFVIAPYRSPKFHVTRPGTRTLLKPRQRLHPTRDTPEESEDVAFYRRLHSYKDRGDPGYPYQNALNDGQDGDWADESTLIAMLQEKCVSLHLHGHCYMRHICTSQ